MRKLLVAAALALTMSEAKADLNIAIGALTLAGVDLQVGYRPQHSHWEFGYRFIRTKETFEFEGIELTDTTTTKTGPLVNYFFRPDAQGSWYLGAALYHWTQDEASVRTGTTDKASTIAPFIGGGYRKRFTKSLYWDLGALFTYKTLVTRTADSTEETRAVDVRVQLGIAF